MASEVSILYDIISAQGRLLEFYGRSSSAVPPRELTDALVAAQQELNSLSGKSSSSSSSEGSSKYSLPEYKPLPLMTESIDPLRVDQNVFLPPILRGNISSGVAGLVNMGNTCFVNSTLQSLMAAEWFRNRILSLSSDLDTPQPITSIIDKFARCFWDAKMKPKGSSSTPTLPTSSIIHALPSWLGGFRQQDAQEFLIWLLDVMRDEAKAVIKANRNANAVIDRSRRAASRSTSYSGNFSLEATRKFADTWIDEIFGNLTVSTVTCSHCHTSTQKFESNLMISLEIPLTRLRLPVVATRHTPPLRIQDCLDEYFNAIAPEKIDDFACLNCTLIDRVVRATSAAETIIAERPPTLDPVSLLTNTVSLLSRCKQVDLAKLGGQIDALLALQDKSLDKTPLFQLQETLAHVSNKLERLETTITHLQAGDQSVLHSGTSLITALIQLSRSLEDILVEIDVIIEIVSYMHASASGLSPKTPPMMIRPAFKKLSLQQQPGCLVLQIKRFHITPHASVKLQHIITLSAEIDLAQYMSDEFDEAAASGKSLASTKYQLFAVVEHQGQLSSGHYIAYVQKSTGWFRCSDSHVTSTTIEQVLHADAYLLFYQRF